MRPVITTEKHIVQQSLASVAGGALSVFVIAVSLQTPVAATATNVREGSKISAVYVEMWYNTDDATNGTCIATLEKRSSGLVAMTAAQSGALDAYANKKNILHTFMGIVPGLTNTYPMAIIKGWIKIPKGKQRFGIGDTLVLNIHGQSNGGNFCGFSIFKEQF